MEQVNNQELVVPPKHQLAKLMIGTAASFLANMAVQKAYDAILEHRNKTPEIDPQ